MAYPVVVYFGLSAAPPGLFVALGLSLIGVRLYFSRSAEDGVSWIATGVAVALVSLALLRVSPELAVKAYPVLASLTAAAVFAISLIRPPTVVERIARLSMPDLPPEGVRYTRNVTIVWTAFLGCNALVSAATALWGSLEAWTLWNGLLSYLAMGALFAVEYAIRRRVRP